MGKTVQIDVDLFLKLVDVFNTGEVSESDFRAIRERLNSKMDALVQRQHYSASKTAETDDERIEARQKYIERKYS